MSHTAADRMTCFAADGGRRPRRLFSSLLWLAAIMAVSAGLIWGLAAPNTNAQSNTSFAETTFQPRPGYGVQLGSWLNADFNGDGNEDLIHLCCGDYANVWLSQGDGSFSETIFQPRPGYGVQLGSWQSADFNGDGNDDLIHFWGADSANVWLSQGDGTFSEVTFAPRPGYGMQLGSWQSADFNGDGDADLIHLCCDDFANVWLSQGDGSFSETIFQPRPGYGVQLGSWQSADFNGDGDADLIHLCCDDFANVWLSQGDGSFAETTFQPRPGYGVQLGSWQSADFNGDGDDDLIHLCCGDFANVWLSQGDGSFAETTFQPRPGYGVQLGSWQSADFNGDGNDDLIHLCCDDYANVWLSQGDGSFAETTFQPRPGYGVQLGSWQSADFNGDGNDDLIHLCCDDYANVWLSTIASPTPTDTPTPTPTPTSTPTPTPSDNAHAGAADRHADAGAADRHADAGAADGHANAGAADRHADTGAADGHPAPSPTDTPTPEPPTDTPTPEPPTDTPTPEPPTDTPTPEPPTDTPTPEPPTDTPTPEPPTDTPTPTPTHNTYTDTHAGAADRHSIAGAADRHAHGRRQTRLRRRQHRRRHRHQPRRHRQRTPRQTPQRDTPTDTPIAIADTHADTDSDPQPLAERDADPGPQCHERDVRGHEHHREH